MQTNKQTQAQYVGKEKVILDLNTHFFSALFYFTVLESSKVAGEKKLSDLKMPNKLTCTTI